MSETVALVTGAARGIGLATATLVHNEGRRVVMLDRDAPELERAASALPGAQTMICDVSRPHEVAQTVAGRGRAEHGTPRHSGEQRWCRRLRPHCGH